MGMKDRIKKIERSVYGGQEEPPCEACGGVLVVEEIHPDGTVIYWGGEPCEVCGGGSRHGGIGWLTYDHRACGDAPPS